MSKKLALVVAIILVAVCVLAGCGKTESYERDPLTGDTSGAVISNGGLAVIKGDYLYFVNGALGSYTTDNTYGTPNYGAIMRISLFNFEQAMVSSNTTDVINDKAVVLVPKYFYSGNTSDKSINGIFIYNERLYYFTPDTSLDKNGYVQSGKLAIKSCKLDGTDTQHHYVFASNTYSVALLYNGSAVTAVYLDTKTATLYSIDLSVENSVATVVSEKVSSVKYDVENGKAFYINADGDIYLYTFGAEPKMVVDNPTVTGDTVTTSTFTMVNIYKGVLYYKGASNYNQSAVGVFSVTANGTITKLLTYTPSNIYCYDNKVLISSGASESYNIVEYNPAEFKTKELVKSTKAITIDKVLDGKIYYTINNEYLATAFDDIEKPLKLVTTTIYTNWATQDVCGEYVFFIDSSSKGTLYLLKGVVADGKTNEKILQVGIIPES